MLDNPTIHEQHSHTYHHTTYIVTYILSLYNSSFISCIHDLDLNTSCPSIPTQCKYSIFRVSHLADGEGWLSPSSSFTIPWIVRQYYYWTIQTETSHIDLTKKQMLKKLFKRQSYPFCSKYTQFLQGLYLLMFLETQ